MCHRWPSTSEVCRSSLQLLTVTLCLWQYQDSPEVAPVCLCWKCCSSLRHLNPLFIAQSAVFDLNLARVERALRPSVYLCCLTLHLPLFSGTLGKCSFSQLSYFLVRLFILSFLTFPCFFPLSLGVCFSVPLLIPLFDTTHTHTQALHQPRRWFSWTTAPLMSTTSAWIANMHSLQSRRNHFANTQMANDSSTPRTQMSSSTPPLRIVPRCASSLATSAGCCSKICPTGSPTSPATSNMPTRAQRQRPQWWRKVSWPCQSLCQLSTSMCTSFYSSSCCISLIAELLLPCSAWSVLLQSCSGLLLTLMILGVLLESHWLWSWCQSCCTH